MPAVAGRWASHSRRTRAHSSKKRARPGCRRGSDLLIARVCICERGCRVARQSTTIRDKQRKSKKVFETVYHAPRSNVAAQRKGTSVCLLHAAVDTRAVTVGQLLPLGGRLEGVPAEALIRRHRSAAAYTTPATLVCHGGGGGGGDVGCCCTRVTNGHRQAARPARLVATQLTFVPILPPGTVTSTVVIVHLPPLWYPSRRCSPPVRPPRHHCDRHHGGHDSFNL